jgi:hypothetical protein
MENRRRKRNRGNIRKREVRAKSGVKVKEKEGNNKTEKRNEEK